MLVPRAGGGSHDSVCGSDRPRHRTEFRGARSLHGDQHRSYDRWRKSWGRSWARGHRFPSRPCRQRHHPRGRCGRPPSSKRHHHSVHSARWQGAYCGFDGTGPRRKDAHTRRLPLLVVGAADGFTHLECGGQSRGGLRLSNREHAYNRKQLVGARHQRSTRLQHFLASGELGDPRDDDRVQGKYSRAHERHTKYWRDCERADFGAKRGGDDGCQSRLHPDVRSFGGCRNRGGQWVGKRFRWFGQRLRQLGQQLRQ